MIIKLSLAGIKDWVAIAGRVIESLRDHAADESIPWSLYDLSCRSPAGFELAGRSVVAGGVRLDFSRGSSSLSFWKVADVPGEERMSDPTGWFAHAERKVRRWYRFEDVQAEVAGHPARLTREIGRASCRERG